MADNPRSFEAGPDPFGRLWKVELRWQQNRITIRHADTVDVKFVISTPGEPSQEKVIALSHPHLLALSQKTGTPLSDSWSMKLAGLHLKHMISSFEDMDKTVVMAPESEIENYAAQLQGALAHSGGD